VSEQALYQLKDVRHSYGGQQVLDIPALTVRRGEILALIGPSGAGKSTLLRLLNFLESPASGEIRFDGQAVNGQAPLPLRRQVTTVFQTPALLERSVAANVAYGLGLRGEKLAAASLQAWLSRLGLAGLEKRRPQQLSMGEAQRVALARALVIRPVALLLDEPTANLDPYNVGLIEEIVRQENEATGMTVVLVTHNVFQARRLAHRTALLLNGRLVEIGPTESFFTRPQQPQTAAFLRGDLVY
jgi:tungstate transport system ATP-binding protein